jgi:outer membrane scaffolding protein for murein synthesis (MipA/OmpV family)
MTFNANLPLLAGTAIAALLIAPAEARERAADHVAVAVGVLATPDYEGSNDYILSPAGGAIVEVDGITLKWRGNAVSLDLVPDYKDQTFKITAGPYFNLNFDRALVPSDPVVSLARKRKVALEGGGFIGFSKTGVLTSKYDTLSARIAVSYDLGNVHHSFMVTPTVEYLMPVSHSTLLGALVSADVVGGRYARYYFGIGPTSSALTGLQQYRPSGGLKSASLAFLGAVALHGDLQKRGPLVGATITYERLFGSFADSPLVAQRGSPNNIYATAGVGYQF